MALAVDPLTFVITVGKVEGEAGMTRTQLAPTEIWSLNINSFRLALKDWEDDLDGGITFLKTHTHNPEVLLGGLTYARVVEILAPYTITFEDGQYAVNLVGANSNIGDRVNVNQVSVRSQNSAGLISTPLIEFSSFEGGVWWDPTNETGQAISGTLFPAGIRKSPSLLLTDVKAIAENRGLNTVYLIGDGTVNTGLDFTRYVFEGQTHVNNTATIDPSADVTGAVFKHLTITGTLDGGNEIIECIISNLNYVNGHIHSSGLIGSITLAGGSDAIIMNCVTLDPFDPPVIDMGASGQNLVMPNYAGLLTIENFSGAGNFIGVGLNAGTVTLDSTTVTNGTIHISGIGSLVDESNNTIPTGTWNTNVTIINNALEVEHIADHVWEASTAVALDTRITELHKLQGLAAGLPMTVTPTSRAVDDIELEITGDGETTTTVTRQ